MKHVIIIAIAFAFLFIPISAFAVIPDIPYDYFNTPEKLDDSIKTELPLKKIWTLVEETDD